MLRRSIYQGEEDVSGHAESLDGCCLHSPLHDPGHFADDHLHDAQVEHHVGEGAEEYDHRDHLERHADTNN